MKCEIHRSGKKIAGPLVYDLTTISAILNRQGVSTAALPMHLTGALRIGPIVIRPVSVVRPAIKQGERYVSDRVVLRDDVVEYHYKVMPYTVEEYRPILLATLSEVHDRYESERFEYRGVLIKQDIEARTNALGVLRDFETGLATRVDWRGKVEVPVNGDSPRTHLINASIPIETLEDMQALSSAVTGNLKKAFVARGMVESYINNCSHMTDVEENGTVTKGLANLDVGLEFKAAIAGL